MHLRAVAGVLSKVRCTADRSCAIDWRQQREVTARVVHLAAAQRHGIQVLLEPEAQITHPADKVLLRLAIGAVVAIDTACAGIGRTHLR